jgi:hypothetical protein
MKYTFIEQGGAVSFNKNNYRKIASASLDDGQQVNALNLKTMELEHIDPDVEVEPIPGLDTLQWFGDWTEADEVAEWCGGWVEKLDGGWIRVYAVGDVGLRVDCPPQGFIVKFPQGLGVFAPGE